MSQSLNQILLRRGSGRVFEIQAKKIQGFPLPLRQIQMERGVENQAEWFWKFWRKNSRTSAGHWAEFRWREGERGWKIRQSVLKNLEKLIFQGFPRTLSPIQLGGRRVENQSECFWKFWRNYIQGFPRTLSLIQLGGGVENQARCFWKILKKFWKK